MNSEYEIRTLDVKDRHVRQTVETFLGENGLRLAPMEAYYGVFRLEEDELLAGGGLYKDIIKCVAVRQEMREERLFNMLVSHLMSEAMQHGYFSTKVYTKPQNLSIFLSLGFKLIAQSPHAIFLENSLSELNQYKKYLTERSLAAEGDAAGLIIMNANPFTRGHRYLVEQASEKVDRLFVIVVKENASLFDYRYRLEMVKRGCADLENVSVLEGSDYQISAATFPTYFLKQVTDATDEHILMDLDVCLKHIIPSLSTLKESKRTKMVRFVGSEPDDRLTARYNQQMKETLPTHGVEVVEIDRMKMDGETVSASTVRKGHKLSHLYPTSIPYAIGVFAAQALKEELELTPKPGLIDKQDNGSHSDMTFATMLKSINAIEPYMIELAHMGYQLTLPTAQEIVGCGLAAEQAMMDATKGVNTHKGAVFSLGLFCIATANSMYHLGQASPNVIQSAIQAMAQDMAPTSGTHGAAVRKQYHIKGALDMALEGYQDLFDKWLPFYQKHIEDDHPQLRLLLHIISSLDDNNLYHRGGKELAHEAQLKAAQVAEHFSIENILDFNDWMKSHNLSPGGSADMLALTLFASHLLYNI